MHQTQTSYAKIVRIKSHAQSSIVCKPQPRKVSAMGKTIEQIRSELKASEDPHLRALALLDNDRLAKLASWLKSLDKVSWKG